MKKEKMTLYDVLIWLEGVGNESVLKELKTSVEARLIYLKYVDEAFDF